MTKGNFSGVFQRSEKKLLGNEISQKLEYPIAGSPDGKMQQGLGTPIPSTL